MEFTFRDLNDINRYGYIYIITNGWELDSLNIDGDKDKLLKIVSPNYVEVVKKTNNGSLISIENFKEIKTDNIKELVLLNKVYMYNNKGKINRTDFGINFVCDEEVFNNADDIWKK